MSFLAEKSYVSHVAIFISTCSQFILFPNSNHHNPFNPSMQFARLRDPIAIPAYTEDAAVDRYSDTMFQSLREHNSIPLLLYKCFENMADKNNYALSMQSSVPAASFIYIVLYTMQIYNRDGLSPRCGYLSEMA